MEIEIIGWIGAALILAAYGLLAMRKIAPTRAPYHVINVVGALLLALYSYFKIAWAEVAINLIWAAIGAGALLVLLRAAVRKKNA